MTRAWAVMARRGRPQLKPSFLFQKEQAHEHD